MPNRFTASFLLAAAVACAFPASPALAADRSKDPDTYLIRNVRVFDGYKMLPVRNVLVDGGLIVAMDHRGDAPRNAVVLEGQGYTLMPALIDARTADAAQIQAGPRLRPDTVKALIAAAHSENKLAVVHAAHLVDARTALDLGADGVVQLFAGEDTNDAEVQAYARLARERKAFIVPGPDQQRAVAALQKAGVPLLAGDLNALMRDGLSPSEALTAATGTPARELKLANRGRIGNGVRADMVLVDGDPTRDIAAAGRVIDEWKSADNASAQRKVAAQ